MRRVEYQASVAMMTWLTESDAQDLVKQHILAQPQIHTITQDLGYQPRWTIWPLVHQEVVNIRCTFDLQESELTWLLVRHPESSLQVEY